MPSPRPNTRPTATPKEPNQIADCALCLSLPQIKFEHIDGVILRGAAWQLCCQQLGLLAERVHEQLNHQPRASPDSLQVRQIRVSDKDRDRYAYQLFADGAVGQIGFLADDNAARDNDIFCAGNWLPRLSHSNSVACR